MLRKIDTWITKIINFILVIMLFATALLIFINVILRYLFSSGFNGTYELVGLLIGNITFIGASLLITDNEHLTMDAIVEILPSIIKKILEVIVCFVGMTFSIVLFIYSYKVIGTLETGVTPTLQIPSYIPFLPIAIGSFITVFKFIKRIIIIVKKWEGS